MEAIENLLTLARSRNPASRGRLLDAVVTLCEDQERSGRPLAPPVRQTLEAILMSLVADAERDIRQRLAEKLATASWAPPAVVNALAVDDIDIAAPIIAGSPLLQDADLLRILTATLEHQMAVARRPGLGSTVVDAIVETGDSAVLTALASNDTAQIGPDSMERLVEFSREVAAVRSPLARHPRLSAELAERLYMWVGQSLRSALASRFRIDEVALAEVIGEVSQQASRASPAWTTISHMSAQAVAETERALIAKLHASGQLRPGFLLRVLRDGRLNLFIEAIAALGGFEPAHIRRAIDSERPELLALACVAVGIDRSAFPPILHFVRLSNFGLPGGGDEGLRRATGAFGPFNETSASSAFKRALSAIA